jgi:hypothetical protein
MGGVANSPYFYEFYKIFDRKITPLEMKGVFLWDLC